MKSITPIRTNNVSLPNPTEGIDNDLEYTILDEEVYDVPAKVQIDLNVLVSGKLTEQGLRSVLNKLYSETMNRTGFKHHIHPSAARIYLYTSKKRAYFNKESFIALLIKRPNSEDLDIRIHKGQLNDLYAKPVVKYGLDETTRKKIWEELINIEDIAAEEAKRKYPELSSDNQDYFPQFQKQINLQVNLEEKYKNVIAKKYNITLEQLTRIAVEAAMKSWYMPPRPYIRK